MFTKNFFETDIKRGLLRHIQASIYCLQSQIGTRNTRYWFLQSQRLSGDNHNSGLECECECKGFHSLHIVSIDSSQLIHVSAFSFQLFRFMLVFVLWMKSTHVRFAAFRKIFLARGRWTTWLCLFSLPCQSHVYILLFFDLLNRRHLKRKINLSSHFDSLRLPASQTWLRKKEDEKRPPEKISKIYFVNVFDRALATTASEESILSGTCRNDGDRTGDAAVVANYSLTE